MFYPFTSIMWIDGKGNYDFYVIKVCRYSRLHSGYFLTNFVLKKVSGNTGADGEGSIAVNNARSIIIGQFNVTYSVFQIYGTVNPTICELFFYLQSAEVKARDERILKPKIC